MTCFFHIKEKKRNTGCEGNICVCTMLWWVLYKYTQVSNGNHHITIFTIRLFFSACTSALLWLSKKATCLQIIIAQIISITTPWVPENNIPWCPCIALSGHTDNETQYKPTHAFAHRVSASQVREWWTNCLSSQLTLRAIQKLKEEWLEKEWVSRKKTICLVGSAFSKWTCCADIVEDQGHTLIRFPTTDKACVYIKECNRWCGKR